MFRSDIIKKLDKKIAEAKDDDKDTISLPLKFIETINKTLSNCVSQEVLCQIRWERDLALSQLEEIGKGLGSKMDDIVELQKKSCCKCEHCNG